MFITINGVIKMRLMDKKIEKIIIKITPEMKKRIQELDQSVLDEIKKDIDINKEVQDVQYKSILEASKYIDI